LRAYQEHREQLTDDPIFDECVLKPGEQRSYLIIALIP